MTKTKAKATGKAKATTKKRKSSGSGSGSRKPQNFGTVRKKIGNMVGKKAVNMVGSAISEAGKGHFPAMKYLFEMSGLYPAVEAEGTPEEESLAKTLLLRLGVPEEPIVEGPATKDSPAMGAGVTGDAVK
jgi:hypothetical protein